MTAVELNRSSSSCPGLACAYDSCPLRGCKCPPCGCSSCAPRTRARREAIARAQRSAARAVEQRDHVTALRAEARAQLAPDVRPSLF